MSEYELKIIAGSQTFNERVTAENFKIQDGAYIFYNIVEEIEKGYVPLGDSGIRSYKKTVALYPVNRTIIVEIRDKRK